ncbi:hypothetical protein HNQ74_000151 [Bartonella doshiae]|uniref:Uncharacterized protein n=2 Tax=Bartonella doshiae TaxID=33044 RepID=A0A380ZHA0_BARDO|nr:hypothetical protein MCS_01090 [Bartonella doshiae NCTC 12862 = ATCC 700133]MBB6158745.1 hypothetical protein [Bartonella doshiae]SUV45900.1 Uncharacterised protein [Bartonella doshiae]
MKDFLLSFASWKLIVLESWIAIKKVNNYLSTVNQASKVFIGARGIFITEYALRGTI